MQHTKKKLIHVFCSMSLEKKKKRSYVNKNRKLRLQHIITIIRSKEGKKFEKKCNIKEQKILKNEK